MKAVIAEIDKKQMIVITDKGDFLKVKRQMSAAIGDEIELKPKMAHLTYRKLAGMAACVLMCIFLSTGVYAYYTPYSYVSVDINPSIALSLNRFERVISVNPLNEDAVTLLKDTKNLKNQDINDALSEIIKSASEKGYIDEKVENQIMVVVSTENPKQKDKLASTVNTTAAKELSKVNNNYGITVEKTDVSSYKAALSNKVSPGKEILAEKLREVIPEIKDEEIINMSVKEAVQLIKEGRKAVKAAEKDSKDNEKDNKKDNDEKEHAINNKDNKKQNGNEGAKAAAEAKDNKMKDNKEKPAPASINNGNSKEKADEEKLEKEGKGTETVDSEADAEDKNKNKNKSDNDNANVKNGEGNKKIEDKDKKNDDTDGKGKNK